MFWKTKNPLEDQTFDELLTQKLAIEDELGKRTDTELAFLKEKLALIAQFRGVELEEVLKEPRKKRVAVAKYQHPEDASLTWSGRGKPPTWLQDLLDSGADKQDFAIA